MVTYQGSDLASAVEEAAILRRIWGANLTMLDTSSVADSPPGRGRACPAY
jgi:hypothetical protein